jgi:hypothetical protein
MEQRDKCVSSQINCLSFTFTDSKKVVIVNDELGEVVVEDFPYVCVCVCLIITIVSGLSHTPFAVVILLP